MEQITNKNLTKSSDKSQKDNLQMKGPNYRAPLNQLKLNNLQQNQLQPQDNDLTVLNVDNKVSYKAKINDIPQENFGYQTPFVDTKSGPNSMPAKIEQRNLVLALNGIRSVIQNNIDKLAKLPKSYESQKDLQHLKKYISDIASLVKMDPNDLFFMNSSDVINTSQLKLSDLSKLVNNINEDTEIQRIEEQYDLQILRGVNKRFAEEYRESKLLWTKNNKEEYIFLSPSVKEMYQFFDNDYNKNKNGSYHNDKVIEKIKSNIDTLMSELSHDKLALYDNLEHTKIGFLLKTYSLYKTGLINQEEANKEIDLIHNSKLEQAASYLYTAIMVGIKILNSVYNLGVGSGPMTIDLGDKMTSSKSFVKLMDQNLLLEFMKDGKTFTKDEVDQFRKKSNDILQKDVYKANHGQARYENKAKALNKMQNTARFNECKEAHLLSMGLQKTRNI